MKNEVDKTRNDQTCPHRRELEATSRSRIRTALFSRSFGDSCGRNTPRAVFPPPAQIFRAFDECPFDKVKVVILGQDPYHGAGQATGLCFAVGSHGPRRRRFKTFSKKSKPTRPSGLARSRSFALGATGRVAAERNAHRARKRRRLASEKGWEQFTDAAVHSLSANARASSSCYGAIMRGKRAPRIDRTKHLVLESPIRPRFRRKRLFRLQAFLQSERLPRRAWANADRMVSARRSKRHRDEPMKQSRATCAQLLNCFAATLLQ